jgi:hypothetical protein
MECHHHRLRLLLVAMVVLLERKDLVRLQLELVAEGAVWAVAAVAVQVVRAEARKAGRVKS